MINVVKIGGNVIDDPTALGAFLDRFTSLPGSKILIHGGGKEASRISRDMGIEPHMIDGRRVTDGATLDIVTMVYAGLINKRIVAALQARGVDAVGLSGADGNVIPATRRTATPVDFGYVGDIDPSYVSDTFLGMLLDGGYVPVVCAICHDEHGTLLNCNADTVAAAVAVGASRLGLTNLTYCFEMDGVLSNVDDPTSVIPTLTRDDFDDLRAHGIVAGGMLPKLTTALDAANRGVSSVRICRAESLGAPGGTIITAR